MTQHWDDEVWSGLERRLSGVESMIPATPSWRPSPSSAVDEKIQVLPGPAFDRSGAGRSLATPRLVWLLVVVVLTAALILGAILSASRPRLPSRSLNGLIAYEIDSSGGSGSGGSIHLIEPDGSGDRVLPTGQLVGLCPRFSPDGTQLAYWAGSSGGVDLYVADVDRLQSRRIIGTRTGLDFNAPTWSPDGSRVAYIKDVPGGIQGQELRVVSLSDAVGQTIVPAQSDLHAPSWSPDGGTIALIGGSYEAAVVYLVSPDGSQVRRVAAPGATTVAWSPDGRLVAYTRYAPGATSTDSATAPPTAIYVMNADGSAATDLTPTGTDAFNNPAWSPDGSRLAYWGGPRDGMLGDLASMNGDGSDARPIQAGIRSTGHAVWSPDGRQLVVVADPPGTLSPGGFAGLVLMSAAGNGPLRVLVRQTLDPSCGPSWQRLAP